MASDFDKDVLELRAKNERKLKELGLGIAAREFKDAVAAEAGTFKAPARRKRERTAQEGEGLPAEIRRSTRERAKVTYNEDAAFRELLPSAGPRVPRRLRAGELALTEEEVEALRALQAAKKATAKGDGEEGGRAKGPRGPRDSGKGVRRQGGQVYDSSAGVTCHWCRQKTAVGKVTCTNPDCGDGRRMPISFCPRCLLNRHGEDPEDAEASGAWVCPCCRGSCGPGCVACCNCGPCRKKLGLEATGQIMAEARTQNYTNAHDYLVGLTTGENQEELTKRKLTQPWAVWMRGPGPRAEPALKEEEAGEEEEEAGEEEEGSQSQGGSGASDGAGTSGGGSAGDVEDAAVADGLLLQQTQEQEQGDGVEKVEEEGEQKEAAVARKKGRAGGKAAKAARNKGAGERAGLQGSRRQAKAARKAAVA